MKSTKVYFDDDYNEDNDPKTVLYTFSTSLKNIPATKIIAYYIDQKGNFVVGQAYLELNNNLNNYVSLLSNIHKFTTR